MGAGEAVAYLGLGSADALDRLVRDTNAVARLSSAASAGAWATAPSRSLLDALYGGPAIAAAGP